MTAVRRANTASLLLPVYNLTNLLALGSRRWDWATGDISLALWPAISAIAATLVVMAVIHLRELRGRYRPRPPRNPRTGRC
jgi:arsenical pump membrane protein